MDKKKFYLVEESTYYGAPTIAGKRQVMSTYIQNDASLTYEEEVVEVVKFLRSKGINVKLIEYNKGLYLGRSTLKRKYEFEL